MSTSNPNLIEPGTRYFLGATLKQCRKFKEKYNFYFFNIIALFFLIGLLASIMIIMYKGKLTPLEKAQRSKEQKEYILSKIKGLQDIKRQKRQELITNLPKWNSDVSIQRKLYK
tara:strand:- start:87 stop:428 length:342 start_codon:yes stop_codon:yes gene_type:complete